MGDLNVEKWNKKAKSFPRFFPNNKEVLDNLAVLEKMGFCLTSGGLKGAKVVDIGCGNGRYALQIAQHVREVVATDIAENMIEILREDAATHGISNVKTICGNWDDVARDGLCDGAEVAFASVTPALNNFQSARLTLERFPHLAYIGWGRKRNAPFLQRFFDMFGARVELPVGTEAMCEYIKKVRGFSPKVLFQDWQLEHRASFAHTLENIKWHLDMHKVDYDPAVIERELRRDYSENDEIVYTTYGEQGFIYI